MPTVAPSNVKLAHPNDEEALMAMLRMRHLEDGIGSFDEDEVRSTIRRGTMRDFSYIGIIRDGNTAVASIGLFVSGFWYSKDSHLCDFWNFVMPDYRRTTHAKNLLLFAKWMSEQLGTPLVMAKIDNPTTAQLIKLYERQLPRSGGLFVYNAGQAVA